MLSIPLTEFYKCGALISLDPHTLHIAWGKRIWRDTPSTSNSWYAPDFFLHESSPWFSHEHEEKISLRDLQNLLKPDAHTDKPHWQQPYESLFRNACLDLQNQIQQGILRKGVPYVFELSPTVMSATRLNRSLHHLLEYAQRLPVSIYGFWEKGQGMIGATPERLFSIPTKHSGLVESAALAGTTHRRCPKQLMSDPKEREEHQIVIEGIQDSLSKFGKVTIGETKIVSLATLAHLKTPIAVELKSTPTFQEIVHALHPTPALGAYPKQEGWCWLQKYQNNIDRRRYGAPFGYVSPQEQSAQCLVAIRNVQWDSSGMKIGAGCGVVAESNVDHEWSEVQAKITAIKDILGL